MKFTVKIDTDKDLKKCPTFVFDNLSDAIDFTRLCFKNGYDVYMKSDEWEDINLGDLK